jgi:hypothetical protein
MKTGLSFLLACISTLSYAQQAIIEPDNPSPRVGDVISLNIILLNSASEVTVPAPEKTTAIGSLKLTKTLLDTGAVNIGPFSFTVNNQTYEAPVISLRVRPALPEKEARGLWASIVEYQDYIYVVIEQRIPSSIKRDPANPNTLVLATDEPEFAELLTERLTNFGLEFISSSVNMENQVIERKGTAVNVSYRLASYKFRRTGAHPPRILINKALFSNFPKGVSFEDQVLE